MNRNHDGRRGFTLPEMMVSVVIVAVIGGGLVMAFKAGQISSQSAQAHMGVSYELRRGVDAMSQELTSSRDDQLLGVPADGNWYNTLTFRLPVDLNGDGTVLDAAGALEWSANPITYSLGGISGDQIVRTHGTQLRVLTNGVQALQFRRMSATPDQVEIGVTVQRRFLNGFQNQGTLTTRVRLRN